MEELCLVDGGVKVYETVILSAQEYARMKDHVPEESGDYFGPDFRLVRRVTNLVGVDEGPEQGRGQLIRWYEAIYRKSDQKMLGESVTYIRRGGDFITLGFHPSGSSCPKSQADLGDSVILKGN